MEIVRGTALRIRTWFHPEDGVQPTSATCAFCYRTAEDHHQTAVVSLTLGVDDDGNPVWTGSWDTSVAGPGHVEWAVQSVGSCQVADEGCFTIVANKANLEGPDEWPHDHDEFRS